MAESIVDTPTTTSAAEADEKLSDPAKSGAAVPEPVRIVVCEA